MKRLAFYTFWEKNGIVRKYVLTYLKGLQEVADRIIVIANGNLSTEGKETLERLGVDVLQRENRGIDFGAWKAAFDYLGWNEVRRFDELILTNCCCYGPVYPFSESFQKMEGNSCDFWGLTLHQEDKKAQLIPDNPDSYVRKHLQSFFIVLRQKVLLSDSFKSYWDRLKYSDSFLEEVYTHETQFTEALSSFGLTYDAVFKTEDTDNPSFFHAYDFLKERYPLVKRKLFNFPEDEWTKTGEGEIPRLILEKLKAINYPVEEIFEDLLATNRLSLLNNNIHFNKIISDNNSSDVSAITSEKKIAAIFFAYYPDYVDRYLPYILNLPDKTHICLISAQEETLEAYKKVFCNYDLDVEYRLKENQGRDFAAYCIAGRDIFDKYDYICCVKDKKSPQIAHQIGQAFDKLCWDGVLFSKDYVNNCISLLYKNKSLGMIFPPPPNFGPFTVVGNEMGPDKLIFERLWKMLGIKVPFDEEGISAPFGSVFWIKKEAARTILSHHWIYEEMPAEPLGPDGTLLHGIERIWAYAAQNDGFYPLVASPSTVGEVYYGNAFLRYRNLSACLFDHYGTHNYYEMMEILSSSKGHENFDSISVVKLVKYSVLAKILSGKRKNHYCKKLRGYMKKFM